jgi:hypothetical protein
MADALGAEPSELMPTLWAFKVVAIAKRMTAKRSVLRFFILFGNKNYNLGLEKFDGLK